MEKTAKQLLSELRREVINSTEYLARYGIFVNIYLDEGVDEEETNPENIAYCLVVNHDEYSDELTYDEAKGDILGLRLTFRIFAELNSRHYDRIMFDRGVDKISVNLRTWPDQTFSYLVNENDTENDLDICPSVRAYIDELSITDTEIHNLVVHSISLDDNNNIRLVGRIEESSMYAYEGEVYTYLGSVLPADIELIDVPECDEDYEIDTEDDI